MASCHNPAGSPGASAKASAVSASMAGTSPSRGQPLQVGRQGRIDRRLESEPGRVHGLLVVQAMRAGDQPGDQEVLPGQGRDPGRDRPGHAQVVVGVGRAFVPGQLQAGQRVAGQVLLREIARVIQIDHGQGTAETAQQITAVIAAPRPHDHLRPHISAGLRQRQHHLGDDEPGLIRAGRLIQGIDDHVEPAAAALLQRRPGPPGPGHPAHRAARPKPPGRSPRRPPARSCPWRAPRRPPTPPAPAPRHPPAAARRRSADRRW